MSETIIKLEYPPPRQLKETQCVAEYTSFEAGMKKFSHLILCPLLYCQAELQASHAEFSGLIQRGKYYANGRLS